MIGLPESPREFQHAFNGIFGALDRHVPGGVAVSWYQSPIGALVIGVADDGVCLLEFSDYERLASQLAMLRRHFDGPIVAAAHAHLEALRAQLDEYFAGRRCEFTVPLVYPGTPFQVRAWNALRTIPYGVTWSYERLATAVGSPGAFRAVGHANGQNRIAIVIPCHRVINKDGKLGGYGGGLWRKQRLLELEGGIGEQPTLL
jgi:AraC family transcriptional regulator of adaptative response/methylated-DNA-[protein]-cysteine methyltransferase